MKKIKRALLWFFLLEKRLFRKIGYVLVLLSIPLLALVISLISEHADGAISVALVAEEPDDPVVAEITEKLFEDEGLIGFRTVGTREEAKDLVKYGSVDEAWILEAGLFNTVSDYAHGKDTGPAVTVYVRQDTPGLLVAREKLTAAISPFLLRETMKGIARSDFDEEDLPSDEEMNEMFDGAFGKSEIFKFSYLDEDESVADAKISYLVAPLRGILAVMTVLGGLATAIFWLKDVESGVFVRFRGVRKTVLAAGYQFAGTLPVTAATVLSIAVAGAFTDPLREILNALLFCAATCAFCSLVRVICGNAERMSVVTPVLTIALLAVSPIFFGMESMRVIHLITPVYYYLSATHDKLFLPLTAAYAAIVAALSIGVGKLRQIITKS